MHNTFDRKKRLSHSKRFQEIFRRGRHFKANSLKVYVYANQQNFSRLGVIIPKKVIVLSTKRHQLKRVIREYFRLHQIAGYDLLVLLKQREYCKIEIRSSLSIIWHHIQAWQSRVYEN